MSHKKKSISLDDDIMPIYSQRSEMRLQNIIANSKTSSVTAQAKNSTKIYDELWFKKHKISIPRVKPGVMVSHKKFGNGEVINFSPVDNSFQVQFANATKKKFLYPNVFIQGIMEITAKIGLTVRHKSYGYGTVVSVEETKRLIRVDFGITEKSFPLPGAFNDGFLEYIPQMKEGE